ncbi:hypothetical protein BJY04DRAFT_113907 [Aspergillus karnatakaensis]|uniref:Zn(II)2Cys6 transcription factor domain-containing protein n=1 Tax=Aspergillus karnatakaensis TaxID=1810916 RepID=UPI003CCD39E3
MSDNFHPNRSPYSNQSPDSAPPAQQSSDWMWRPGSFSGNVPRANYQPQHQHQPQQLPPQPYTYGQYPDPNTQHNVPHNASQQVSFRQPQAHEQAQDRGNKVAIPRATAVKASAERRRSARACESCRQRKVKCDGARPICRKCREHGLECSYIDIKRIRDQKQLGSLSSKVDRYERLMRQMENDVDPMTARRIRKALAVGFPVSVGEK